MTNSLSFAAQTIEEQALLLAGHLPDGEAWRNKFNADANLGKLVIGLAAEYLRVSTLLEESLSEVDAATTIQLIEEWEQSVGIPDDCLEASGSLEQRRENVISKLGNYGGVQTAQDFVDFAEFLGFDVRISNGVTNGVFPLQFPIAFYGSRKEAVHTIIVDLEEERAVFPLSFPILFSPSVTGIIECLFRKLAPANCRVIFRYGVT